MAFLGYFAVFVFGIYCGNSNFRSKVNAYIRQGFNKGMDYVSGVKKKTQEKKDSKNGRGGTLKLG